MKVRAPKNKNKKHPWRKMGEFASKPYFPPTDQVCPILEDLDYLPIPSDEDIINEYKPAQIS